MHAPFWRDKRVFVTGHTGFKGGWLSLWLQHLGARVTGYALEPPTQPSLFGTAGVSSGMTSIIGDVRDGAALANAVHAAKPEIVIHMAAQAIVRQAYDDPVETYSTNIMGTVNLLEAVRQNPGVRAVVNVTSDKCYENNEWVWGYREIDPMGGYDPYSSSKGCSELVTAAYRTSYFNPASHPEHGVALASARAGNVIGGGDWAKDRLIPDFVRAVTAGEPVRIRNPDAVRPWQHVLAPLAGYLTLAERLAAEGVAFAQAWNFGPADADARPVRWIAGRFTELWGGSASWELDRNPQPHEARCLKLDCSRATAHLQWHARWGLDMALRKIVAWHKAHHSGADMRKETLAQVEEYCNS